MRDVVVGEYLFFALRLAYALDHGVVVRCVGQNEAVRHQPGYGRDAGLIGHIARGEDERRLLAMQVGEFALEIDQRVIGTGDIAGSARAGAHAGRRFDHRADHLGMLPHSEVIVRTPHDDVARSLRGMPDRTREAAGQSLEIGKHPVAALVPETGQGICEMRLVVHESRRSGQGSSWNGPKLEAFQGSCRGDNARGSRPRVRVGNAKATRPISLPGQTIVR